ncbi:sigma factor-like helix-turn-helix DNA-binding protein [Rhizomonospora bruguierae]|uniref:sigma factor-like helix-turn-helix DNA-binding protein n=1 Tax=Rhizomonospora bruguierae TaxID=1581705 RepID=UPI001BCE05B1|nr:sigma factor-like helix-turn-helix DNA-binding protein [Micromonospora sp. NBRC 107566]
MGVHDRLLDGLGVSYLPSPTGAGAMSLPGAGSARSTGGTFARRADAAAPADFLARGAGGGTTGQGRHAGGGTTGQGRHRVEPDADAVPLMAFALRLTEGDQERAELIVAETLAHAVDHAPPPGPRRRPWLIAIARRFAADGSWPERETVERVLARMGVAGALEILSRPHREILVETYFRGRSVAEAAEALDLPVVTAQTRLAYALRALRNASTG